MSTDLRFSQFTTVVTNSARCVGTMVIIYKQDTCSNEHRVCPMPL